MRTLMVMVVPVAVLMGCAGSTEFRTVQVSTPNGTYDEKVGLPAMQPAHAPDGGPYVPPTYVRKPVTVYSPNGGATTVDVPEEK